jgi:type II secretory pathway component PulJ
VRRRPGFTLIEMTVVMAALAMILGLLAVALVGALKLEGASAGALQRLGAVRDLADQFRADVAQAADAPERWKDDVAGPTCLILRLGEDRHVVYRWQAGRLLRSESARERTHQYPVALGRGPAAVEFDRSRAGGRLLTVRLFAVRKDGSKQPSAEITAALGGDLQ